MKRNSTISLGIIIIIFAVLVYLYRKSSGGWGISEAQDTYERNNPQLTTTPPINSPSQGSNSKSGANVVLSIGSRGEYVKKLQQLINQANNKMGRPSLKVDGAFGNQTETNLYYLTLKKAISYNHAVKIYNSKFGRNTPAKTGQNVASNNTNNSGSNAFWNMMFGWN